MNIIARLIVAAAVGIPAAMFASHVIGSAAAIVASVASVAL